MRFNRHELPLSGLYALHLELIIGVEVDMHTYQCFGDFWNAVHNDDAGKGLHFDVSCAYAYQVGGLLSDPPHVKSYYIGHFLKSWL